MPERDDPIFLVGFMGAGKSVSGALLARRLGWDFIDLDRLVIDREQRSIAEMFALDGEVGFRQAELRALDTLAVWIDVPLSTSVERCASLPVRPLLRDRAQIESLYRARLPAYRRAPYRVEAVDATSEEIAGRIFALLCSAG
jgi:shikimate kinase